MGSCCSIGRAQDPEDRPQELEQWNPINYVVPGSEAEILEDNQSVNSVHLVSLMALENGGNHWNLFLQTGSERYVQLDMAPGAWPGEHGYLGRLDINLMNHGISSHQHCHIIVPTQPGYTAVNFLNAIFRADNHRYEFTQQGRGCTGWMRDQFALFARDGLLLSGHEDEVDYAVNHEWRQGTVTRPWPLTSGSYLRERKRRGRKYRGT
jgi:hypothetical protein